MLSVLITFARFYNYLLLTTHKTFIQMKRIFTMTGIAFTLVLFASIPQTASAQPRTDIAISYQTFYDELDPYGEWMEYPDYGYVWVPDAGRDFRPYETNGHWVWSDDYEWMWVSDYDWGWAPFHYGRWLMDPYYGWVWVPGYEWSPAWVAWRDGGDYYGWAPLRPGFNISVNINLGGYNPPVDYWCFAPRRYITSPRIWDYCAPRRNNVTIINQTTIINNYNYNRNVFRTGPGRRDAERYAGRINPVRFRESSSPGRTRFRGNEVSVYRPRVQQDNSRQYSPRRFERYDRNGSNGTVRNNRNNLPERRERMENGDLGRRTDRQRSDNGNRIGNNRRVERNDGNDRSQPGTIDRQNRRFERPDNSNGEARPQRNPAQQRRDVFERRSDANDQRRIQQNERRMQQREIYDNRNNGNERSARPTPQMEQRRQEQPRQFERRQEQQQQPRQFERRQEQQQQPRQFERRQEQQQQPRQIERRQEQQQQQPRQQESRQFERRNDGGGGGGNGNGRGRRDR
jgi:hypothetical protein